MPGIARASGSGRIQSGRRRLRDDRAERLALAALAAALRREDADEDEWRDHPGGVLHVVIVGRDLTPPWPLRVTAMETKLWDDLREPPTRAQRWAAVLRKQPSAFLLAVQLLVIVLLPWLQDLTYGRVALTVLSLCALTVAVFTVRSTPALTWLSVLLGLPAGVLEIWSSSPRTTRPSSPSRTRLLRSSTSTRPTASSPTCSRTPG